MYKNSKSVKFLRQMYEFFSSTNVFSLVESCQLYIITNTKPATKIEEGIQRCSVKKVFLKTLQKSREIPCARSPISFLIKLQLKKRLWHRRFPANIAKFSRLPFFIEHFPWLPLVKLTPNLWNQQNFSSSYFFDWCSRKKSSRKKFKLQLFK